jgi:hypothetical protein
MSSSIAKTPSRSQEFIGSAGRRSETCPRTAGRSGFLDRGFGSAMELRLSLGIRSHVNRKISRSITRRVLYEAIWQRPMWKVAPEFGLSGNGLAKLCRREGIPVPERGYWAKLAHGKRVKKPPLPGAAGNSETLIIEATPSNRSGLEDSMPEPLAALLRAEREAAEPIAVPNSPKLHRFVETWPKPQKPSYGVASFTAEGESRRRRIASVLFREIERRGGIISPNKKNERDTDRFGITFFNETIDVVFQERLTMVKVPPDPKRPYSYERTEYHPTGLLRLRFENYLDVPIRREWNDRETNRIEVRLREILIALYLAIEAERLRNERFRQQRAREAEAERRRWEREERERREREEVQAVLEEAKAWEDARRIRSYVKAMKTHAAKSPTWVKWALEVADRLDPAKVKA